MRERLSAAICCLDAAHVYCRQFVAKLVAAVLCVVEREQAASHTTAHNPKKKTTTTMGGCNSHFVYLL